MTPARFQTIEEIFLAAVEQEPEQVSAFLDTACDGDEALRREVEELLASDQKAGRFMEKAAVGLATNIIQNQQAHSLVGQTIDHYKISESIGTGGMGEVYLATDIVARRKAALKLLPLRFTGDAARLKRFEQEAHTVVGLNHPNILTVYEIGEDHSIHYIASELIEGETLRERLTRGPMQLSEAVDVAIQVASALAAAHHAGIVHRDIKPENIMLRPDGYVKVLDFGIAKLAESAFAKAAADGAGSMTLVETNLGSILGTVRYMSPEQACGGQVDKTTDIWSLGVVLYEMVTGHAPFTGDTPQDVMLSILEKEPPPFTRYIVRAPVELQQIISKTLRKDREQRYRSAHELLQALKCFRHKLEVEAELKRSAVAHSWYRRGALAALALALVTALLLAFPFYRQRNLATSSPPDKSVAVLPLQNLSEDKENAFFADGVHDELLSNLAKIKDLKVISRTSVTQYKSGIRRNLKEIAQQLGVGNVVEGSVRRSGDHVRVSVQLIDARTDRHLWGENYDRTLADSLALQGDLATEIAAAVGATLSLQEKARIEAKPTNNAVAYDAYLRGRAFKTGVAWSDNVESAIRSYQEAVKLDPNFTLAWAYLSCAQIGSYWSGNDHSNPAALAPAKDSLDHALALDPNLPETHLAVGYYRYYGQLDFTGALTEFQRAEQGLPNNVDILQALALIQRRLGHWEEAIEAGRRAVELDPRNVVSCVVLGNMYRDVRRFPEALATADRILAQDPTNDEAIWMKASVVLATGDLNAVEPLLANPGTLQILRGMVALFQRRYAVAIEILSKELVTETDRSLRTGEKFLLALSQQRAGDVTAARETYQKAAQEFQRELEKVASNATTHADLGLAYAGLGEAASAIAEGQKALAMQPTSKDAYDGPAREEQMARIYSLLGDADHAIPLLKRLLQIPYYLPITPGWLRLDPVWDQIRNDPRFQELAAENAPFPEKSIAVLPFENLSKDEENAFLAGGVQDEILTDLAKVADLKVISRTSVMKYKSGLERNVREIAKALGVSYVLEGSVQRVGERVRVSAQLIDARNDTHLWAERYDRDVADVVAVQTEIAHQIADQLKANLSPAEKAAIAERPTADLVAYAYYTKAKEIDIYSNWEGAENEKAAKQKVELLEKATQRDPNFALAYCALAKAQMDVENFELAKKAAETALRLRPDLVEPHLALARYCWLTPDSIIGADVDRVAYYNRARDELAIVRRKLPNNAEALLIEALIGRHQNRWDASLANLQKASELDPRNGEVAFRLEQIYFEMRRYSELEQFIRKKAPPRGALEDPFDWLARTKLAQGDPVAAQSLLEQLPPEYSPGWGIWDVRFKAALYLRDYGAVNRVIAATPAGEADETFGGPSGWAEGLVACVRGDKQRAIAAFAAAREKMQAIRADKQDVVYFAGVAKLDAGLGRKEDAIREARHAVELQPISKDSLNGPIWIANLALVYAWTGERDRALEQLEIVATLPGYGPTYGDLHLNPCWDSLRGDKRFDKIVAAAKAASK
jgi:TolB-like protein/cytochrome c-type biogenesis protein CcmH/NrfG